MFDESLSEPPRGEVPATAELLLHGRVGVCVIYEKSGIPSTNASEPRPEATDPRFVDTVWVDKTDKSLFVHALNYPAADKYRAHTYERLTVRKNWIMAERGDRHMLIAVVDDSAVF